MTENGTEVRVGPDGWDNLLLYGCYFFLGLVIGVGNVIIVCAILKYKALRTSKGHLIIMALALADAFNMLAHMWGAIKVFYGTHSVMMPAWDCMWTLHSLIWSFAPNQSTMMLAAVSLDRFFSVYMALDYITWTPRYAWWVIGITYAYSYAVGALGIGLTYHTRNGRPDQVFGSCIPPQAFKYSNKLYAKYYVLTPVVFSMISILLYIAIWFIYKGKIAKVDTSDETTKNQQLEKERKLTKSIGICCTCTLFCYLLPWVVGNVTTWIGYSGINYVFWVMAMINPGCSTHISIENERNENSNQRFVYWESDAGQLGTLDTKQFKQQAEYYKKQKSQ